MQEISAEWHIKIYIFYIFDTRHRRYVSFTLFGLCSVLCSDRDVLSSTIIEFMPKSFFQWFYKILSESTYFFFTLIVDMAHSRLMCKCLLGMDAMTIMHILS